MTLSSEYSRPRLSVRLSRHPFGLLTCLSLALGTLIGTAWSAPPDPEGPGDSPTRLSNVDWTPSDSVAACPSGDSLVAGHPAALYNAIKYTGANGQPRNGVPPESIWVTITRPVGSAATLNDATRASDGYMWKVFADDSTRGDGTTHLTVSGFSGCGSLWVRLYVSGVRADTRVISSIRSTDADLHGGRVEQGDFSSACDYDYDGAVDADDTNLITAHMDHWHRNALHGKLVRRTNYCETCPAEAVGTKGEGLVDWSPSGRFISHTAFVDAGPGIEPACKVFIGTSDPAEGNALLQFTSAPIADHDYDPAWSPLNTEIVFDRRDSLIIRKPVPWLGTAEAVVTAGSCGTFARGDVTPALSPDGQWVVFSRCNPPPPNGPGGWSLWKISITGGAATQLTPTAARGDFYPSWSPDGVTIYFQRQDGGAIGPQWTLWKVPAAGGPATQVFVPPSSPNIHDAAQPASSPDGVLLTLGYGKRDNLVRNVVTHTLDPGLASPTPAKVIPNFPDTNFAEKGDFPLLSPRLSPDGTRLALGSKQVWAARRNMNLPPRITQVGSQSLEDTTARVFMSAVVGLPSSFTVTRTDPENDPVTCNAYFLQDGMSFDPATCTLSWTPTAPVGTQFHVKLQVTTPSGGTDAVIAVLTVAPSLTPTRLTAERRDVEELGPNPTTGSFVVLTPSVLGARARMTVFDVRGRQVAVVEGASGSRLVWDGTDEKGKLVGAGVYLYRLDVGKTRDQGRIVVVR